MALQRSGVRSPSAPPAFAEASAGSQPEVSKANAACLASAALCRVTDSSRVWTVITPALHLAREQIEAKGEAVLRHRVERVARVTTGAGFAVRFSGSAGGVPKA